MMLMHTNIAGFTKIVTIATSTLWDINRPTYEVCIILLRKGVRSNFSFYEDMQLMNDD